MENTVEELRVAMRRLAELPLIDLRYRYQDACERMQRYYTGQESEADMLRHLLRQGSEHGVLI